MYAIQRAKIPKYKGTDYGGFSVQRISVHTWSRVEELANESIKTLLEHPKIFTKFVNQIITPTHTSNFYYSLIFNKRTKFNKFISFLMVVTTICSHHIRWEENCHWFWCGLEHFFNLTQKPLEISMCGLKMLFTLLRLLSDFINGKNSFISIISQKWKEENQGSGI